MHQLAQEQLRAELIVVERLIVCWYPEVKISLLSFSNDTDIWTTPGGKPLLKVPDTTDDETIDIALAVKLP